MQINATIEKISYQPLSAETLQSFDLATFNINNAPTSCIVHLNNTTFAISRWVSPKRTRSYPYERVYNTLGISKKITVIPVVKDEGQNGDRDYLQWDTISLMSLLDVFVIFAYYHKAEKVGTKIGKQQFDNNYIAAKITEIQQFHSSALHWNLAELAQIDDVLEKVKTNYAQIEAETGIKLHSFKGIDNLRNKIGKDVDKFKEFSREKSEKAQAREFVTIQPKEVLSTATKAKLTISNYLGGQYHFTVDEVQVLEQVLYLIEAKHSKNTLLPSKSDIKDGLLKLMLYCNFATVKIADKHYTCLPILKLTSLKLSGSINSTQKSTEIDDFLQKNSFSETQISFVKNLFTEAAANKFVVIIEHAK
jgi:hypothetical protein